MDTHVPYDPAYGTAAPPWPGWSEPAPGDQPPLATWSATQALSDAQRTLLCEWRRAYAGQGRFVDAAIGRLVERLSDLRPRPVLVAVTSDHGEGLFSHHRGPGSTPGPGPLGEAYPDHGEQLYEEALRVPLWLTGPGVPAGRREERPVRLRDLGATLLDLAGVAGSDPSVSERLPLQPTDAVPDAVQGAGTRGWFVRTATRKLTVPFGTSTPDRESGVHLHAVAGARYLPEVDDLSAAEPAVRLELLQRWGRWLDASDEPPPAPPDAETTEHLRMLGYVR
jgi:arylsulfatase A-like enzyme